MQKYTIPAAILNSDAVPDTLLLSSQQQNETKRSKLKNEDEMLLYRLCRGVITLLDGSNREIRACSECHRKRAGVEVCRLARLHSEADWDDDRPSPEPIILPGKGTTFKRVGGATETVLKPIVVEQNRKPVSIPHRVNQSNSSNNNNNCNNKAPVVVIHPITALAAKFQLTGRRFRELPRPPFEEEEKPIEQLIRLEQRVDQMQANVATLLSMTQSRVASSSTAAIERDENSNSNSSSSLSNMDKFFVPLKEKIAVAKATRQPVKEIILFAEVSTYIYE